MKREGKIGKISENDLRNIPNLLAGKFGWSERDPKRKFFLQNVVIGTVSKKTIEYKDGSEFHYLEPFNPLEAE
jgi:hypothetical protein